MSATTNSPSHLLYDGKGGWIEATRVWIGVLGEWGWQFKNGTDAVRWLQA